jgi:formate/nitrite transporter FocA (FNT family)
LNLRSCEYWSAVLTSRSPGQPIDISARTILKLFFSCAIGSSVGAHAVAWLFAFVVSSNSNSFSSLVILFSSQILKRSGHGV